MEGDLPGAVGEIGGFAYQTALGAATLEATEVGFALGGPIGAGVGLGLGISVSSINSPLVKAGIAQLTSSSMNIAGEAGAKSAQLAANNAIGLAGNQGHFIGGFH